MLTDWFKKCSKSIITYKHTSAWIAILKHMPTDLWQIILELAKECLGMKIVHISNFLEFLIYFFGVGIISKKTVKFPNISINVLYFD